MPTTITGLLGSPSTGGTLVPLKSATLYIAPSEATQLRIQYGGSGDFSLVTANTQLPAPYQYGFSTTTDGTGAYNFMLPETGEIHCPSLSTFQWNIALPDGSVYAGAPLEDDGPYSIDDLLMTKGWRLVSSLVVNTTILGQVAQATQDVSGQQSVVVAFAGSQMPDQFYQVVCSPTQDSVSGAVPQYDVTNKTGSGFTIELSFSFTGKVDYIAWHP
jgi:hypothetical protein